MKNIGISRYYKLYTISYIVHSRTELNKFEFGIEEGVS